MSDSSYAVIDRRGQPRQEAEPSREAGAGNPEPGAIPPGEPILVHCNRCGADISRACLAFQPILPVPGPGGSVGFAPQLQVLQPLLCPACGVPLFHGQRVLSGRLG